MSYDVYVGRGESHNYTYNVSKLFYDHIPAETSKGGIHELDGKTGKQAAEIISRALEEINRTRNNLWKADSVGEREFCRLYDAPNGWGSTIGAIMFLAILLNDCHRHPKSKVVVA